MADLTLPPRPGPASGLTEKFQTVVIAAVIGAFIFSPRSEQMARAPNHSQETTLPATANPATPGLPSATPGAPTSPAAPGSAPQH